jgi:hypothetical protein
MWCCVGPEYTQHHIPDDHILHSHSCENLKSFKKVVIIFFLDSRWVVHKEFLSLGVTVDQKYYLDALGLLRKRLMRVLTEIAKDWIL